MAQTKEFFTRIQHKHDIEANWIKAVNFTPLNGEIIVYDKDSEHDYARIKIGDGTTKINELPFMLNDAVLTTEQELTDEQRAQARQNIAKMQYDWREVKCSGIGTVHKIADASIYYGTSPTLDIDGVINLTSVSSAKYSTIGYLHGAVEFLLSSADIGAQISLFMPRILSEYNLIRNSGLLNGSYLYMCQESDKSDEIELLYTISPYNANGFTHAIGIAKCRNYVGEGHIYYNETTGDYQVIMSARKYTDDTLTLADYPADAKAVGDALATKVSFTETQELTDEQKELARTNIGAIDEDNLGVKKLPVLRRETLAAGTAYEMYMTYISIADMEPYVRYTLDYLVDGKQNSYKFIIVCADGTEALVANGAYIGFVYSIGIGAKYTYLYFDNRSFTASYDNINTANNITVTRKDNLNYLGTYNYAEFIPTGEYQPATKKYVDEAISSINIETITLDEIDEICGSVTEGALLQTDVDELMAQLED